LEHGKGKYFKEDLAKNYLDYIRTLPGFSDIESLFDKNLSDELDLEGLILEENPKIEVGLNFLFVRAILGYSLPDVAEALNVSEERLKAFENGKEVVFNHDLAKRYYAFISELQNFPKYLTLDMMLKEEVHEKMFKGSLREIIYDKYYKEKEKIDKDLFRTNALRKSLFSESMYELITDTEEMKKLDLTPMQIEKLMIIEKSFPNYYINPSKEVLIAIAKDIKEGRTLE
jgi:transcriptional regulator with XRE-family HTH domain